MFSRIWLKVISKKAKAQEIRLLSLKCLLWLPLEICTDLKWCHVATIRSQISGLIQQVLAWDSHIVEHRKPVVRERRKCYRKELVTHQRASHSVDSNVSLFLVCRQVRQIFIVVVIIIIIIFFSPNF